MTFNTNSAAISETTAFHADDSEEIHLKISGIDRSQPPIVLLHGWTASMEDWFPFVEALSEHHRVYRWDARGHPASPARVNLPTVSRMARDLANLLEHYRLENAVVVGHSMGALTLWQYLRDFGAAHLGKLCFIDQSPRLVTDADWHYGIYGDFDRERAASFIRELEIDFPEAVLRLAAYGCNRRAREKYEENAKGWQKSRAFLKTLIPAPLIACWQSLTEADYRGVLGRITLPTLLVYGGESNFYSLETARYVHDHIHGSRLSIYENTDHCPHLWQRERFIRDLLSFAQTGVAGD